jgi:hypothetical protein
MINPEIIEKDENNYNMVIKIGWISLLFFLAYWANYRFITA